MLHDHRQIEDLPSLGSSVYQLPQFQIKSWAILQIIIQTRTLDLQCPALTTKPMFAFTAASVSLVKGKTMET